MARIAAGKLNHELSLQARTRARGPMGDIVRSWDAGVLVWGQVRPLSGEELVIAKQVHSLATVEIRIRYKTGVSANDRFVYKGRLFHILAVLNEDEANVSLLCLCREELDRTEDG